MELLNDLDISIRSWKRYPELLKNGKSRVFAFGVLVTLLFWIMTAAVPAAGFLMRTGGYTKLVTENVPEFTLSGGKLAVQGGFHYADGYRYFDINTDPSNSVSLEDQRTKTQLALNSVAVIADSEKMILKTDVALPGSEQGTRMVRFSDYGSMTLTKADVLSFAPIFYAYAAMIGALYFFMNLAAFFFAAAVIASFGMMFARMSGLRLDYGTIYRLTVYSRSVPVLLRGGLWLMGLMFAEYSALGFLYSIFVVTRVFRYLYEEGGDVLLKAGRERRMQEMYPPERRDPLPADPREPEDAPYRDGGNGAGNTPYREGNTGSENVPYREGSGAHDVPYREDGSARDGRIPTPKTPDPGTGAGYDRTGQHGNRYGSVRRVTEEEETAGTADRTGVKGASGSGADGSPAGSAGGRIPTPKSPDGDREARIPDISTVAKPVAGKDLKPSNGWSFGTRDAVTPEKASSAEPEKAPSAEPAGSAPEPPEEKAASQEDRPEYTPESLREDRSLNIPENTPENGSESRQDGGQDKES